jgi:hypothetical protein
MEALKGSEVHERSWLEPRVWAILWEEPQLSTICHAHSTRALSILVLVMDRPSAA